MLTDYTLTARQRLLLFCKEQQPGLALADSNIHFSLPEMNPHNDKNTRVTVSYTGAFMDVPTRVLHYNRLDVEEFFAQITTAPLFLNVATATNTHDILAAILSTYGVAFEPADFVLHPIDGNLANVRIARSSLGWTGAISFQLASSDFLLDSDTSFQLDDGFFFELD